MTTDSPQRPQQGSTRPRQQDRREFLKVAAVIPTALGATQALGADTPADKAKPADTTPMPQIQLGTYSISRLIVGCHNIDGRHMSPFLDKEMHDYYTPERAVQLQRQRLASVRQSARSLVDGGEGLMAFRQTMRRRSSPAGSWASDGYFRASFSVFRARTLIL